MASVRPYIAGGGYWTAARKADLVIDIRRRRIARKAAMRLHAISDEELTSWERRFDRHGHPGLKQTRLQALRP